MTGAVVIRDADVITMEAVKRARPAQAIAIDKGLILAVGTNHEIEPLIGSRTRVLSLSGKTVLPGFIDSHVHFTQTGLGALGPSVYGVTSGGQVLGVVADGAAGLERGQVLLVQGCSMGELDRQLTRHDLDSAAPHNRVVVIDLGAHACLVNTQAWELLGMGADTPGVVKAGDTGEVTGLLVGQANTLARFQFYGMIEDSSRVAAMHRAAEMAGRVGITTVHALDGGSRDGHGWLTEHDVELLLGEAEKLPVRTVVYFQSTVVEKALELGLPRIGGCLLVDGAYGEHTAALLEPYTDDPSTRGVLYFSDEELSGFVNRAHRAGLQISMHAIGDRAIEQLLSAYERALAADPRSDHRHRIEHFSLPTAEHIERAARLGVALGMQPIFAAMPEGGQVEYQLAGLESLGAERFKRRHPYRTIVDAGLLVGGGSDSDAKPMGPLAGIHAVVNHPDEERRLTVMEALSLFTTNAARIGFEEQEKGTIEAGKVADLVVLGENPLVVDPRALRDIRVEMTIVGGETTYDRQLSQ
jgi:predicted amidohydrolase YtcJ